MKLFTRPKQANPKNTDWPVWVCIMLVFLLLNGLLYLQFSAG